MYVIYELYFKTMFLNKHDLSIGRMVMDKKSHSQTNEKGGSVECMQYMGNSRIKRKHVLNHWICKTADS